VEATKSAGDETRALINERVVDEAKAKQMIALVDQLENYLLDIKKPVKAAVESKVTVNEVLHLSKALKKQLKAQNKEMTRLRENFLDLHTQYDTSLADIEAYVDSMMTVRERGQKHILDARFAMKNLMTQAEWSAVFSLKDD
jgi:dynactin complex subunit